MKTIHKVLAIGLLLMLLAACGGGDAEEATATATVADTSVAATPATEPTVAPATPTEAPAQPTTAPEAPTATPETAQAAAPSGDAQEAVMSAISAQLAGGPYRATTTIEADGATTKMNVEMIPPDKLHAIISAAEGNTELILVDGTTWFKSGDTPWMQMPGGDMVQNMLASVQADAAKGTLTNVQLVGTEEVNGQAAQVYAFTSSYGEGDQQVSSDVKLWISEASGLPIKMEATGVAMGTSSHTVQTIEYDDSITIEAPTPE